MTRNWSENKHKKHLFFSHFEQNMILPDVWGDARDMDDMTSVHKDSVFEWRQINHLCKKT